MFDDVMESEETALCDACGQRFPAVSLCAECGECAACCQCPA